MGETKIPSARSSEIKQVDV